MGREAARISPLGCAPNFSYGQPFPLFPVDNAARLEERARARAPAAFPSWRLFASRGSPFAGFESWFSSASARKGSSRSRAVWLGALSLLSLVSHACAAPASAPSVSSALSGYALPPRALSPRDALRDQHRRFPPAGDRLLAPMRPPTGGDERRRKASAPLASCALTFDGGQTELCNNTRSGATRGSFHDVKTHGREWGCGQTLGSDHLPTSPFARSPAAFLFPGPQTSCHLAGRGTGACVTAPDELAASLSSRFFSLARPAHDRPAFLSFFPHASVSSSSWLRASTAPPMSSRSSPLSPLLPLRVRRDSDPGALLASRESAAASSVSPSPPADSAAEPTRASASPQPLGSRPAASLFGLHCFATTAITGSIWWAALRLHQGVTALALSAPVAAVAARFAPSSSWRETVAERARRFAWRINTFWGRMFSNMIGCTPEIVGRENLPPSDEKVIFVANHCSLMDVAYIALAVPRCLRFVAKVELLAAPVVGLAMRLSGCPTVDRDSPESHLALFRETLRLLKGRERKGDGRRAAGTSGEAKDAAEVAEEGAGLVAFPEGKRSADGRLDPFDKGGVFRLAIQTKTRVVPISITGTHSLLPAKSLLPPARPPPGSLKVVIHPPISPNGKTHDELRTEAWEAVRSALPESQQPLSANEE
ncbi:acyltransferase domain-containing protein [Besnoitia besnoiti]|uniref:Acyltransferase domain-containing protein n=1 Tax=Besnoitia besnoiti TaxID=94643 RepID=A0A2A9MHM2_BESBE|nr:acyltransferase domain-containing protein [Besnoitia besnoiti]PFH35446.1 acyltransferase domain-containing protein [Besnoitia besnoiti]